MSGESIFPALEPLLERVSKPIQYVGGELNSTVKDWHVGGHGPDGDELTVRWALMYPDAYEVGVPNQGVMILYEVLNERADALAAPLGAPQVQATMRAYYPTGHGDELQPLLDKGLADAMPLPRYLAWFRSLPVETQRRIENYWGAPENSTMLRPVAGEPAFVIPRVQFGNVVVLRGIPTVAVKTPDDLAAAAALLTGGDA